ncbi:hypothetical protein WQ84_13340 [Escherichia coli]|nr:hypothetical protein WQ84_13340 [Escherichia coli]
MFTSFSGSLVSRISGAVHCGQLTYNVDTRHLFSSPVKGVTTEVVVAGSDSKRRIVLNRYD